VKKREGKNRECEALLILGLRSNPEGNKESMKESKQHCDMIRSSVRQGCSPVAKEMGKTSQQCGQERMVA
jgi:hypothetical protein